MNPTIEILKRFDEVKEALVAREGEDYYTAIRVLLTMRIATQLAKQNENHKSDAFVIMLHATDVLVEKTLNMGEPKNKKHLEALAELMNIFKLSFLLLGEMPPVPDHVFTKVRKILGGVLTDYMTALNEKRAAKKLEEITDARMIRDAEMFLKQVK